MWRRGPLTVLEVLRADGRVETCRLEQIASHYTVEPLHPPLPLDSTRLCCSDNVLRWRDGVRTGKLVDVEGTRLRGQTVIQLEGGKLLRCTMRRIRFVQTYGQAIIEPLFAQLRDVARAPSCHPLSVSPP